MLEMYTTTHLMPAHTAPRVLALYATTPRHPKVEILDIRTVRDTGGESWLIADVRATSALLPHSVKVSELTYIRAMLAQVIE